MTGARISPEERFWSKVDRSGECWIWTGSRDDRGYGHFWDGERLVGAHRFAFTCENGPLSPEDHVCHRCDNPSCVRPAHLFKGDRFANMRDMAAKGRASTWRRDSETCRHGHPWTVENTRWVRGGAARECRACGRAKSRRHRTHVARVLVA